MNEQVKELICWLKIHGERETNPFTKFFFFYMCFDAWITADSGKEIDTQKIAWFLENDNCLKSKWSEVQSSRMTSLLNNLKQMSPVYDTRPNHTHKKRELEDITNIEEVVKFIYQIRCNLFHGGKSPMITRDNRFVEISGEILEKWIVWAVHKCF